MPYCPKCGSEYREGYTECTDCHVSLVAELHDDFVETEVPRVSFWSRLGEAWTGFERGRLVDTEDEARIKMLVLILFIGLVYFLANSLTSYGYMLRGMIKGEPLLVRLFFATDNLAFRTMEPFVILILSAFVLYLLFNARRDLILVLIICFSIFCSLIFLLAWVFVDLAYVFVKENDIQSTSALLFINTAYPIFMIMGISSMIVSIKSRREKRPGENSIT